MSRRGLGTWGNPPIGCMWLTFPVVVVGFLQLFPRFFLSLLWFGGGNPTELLNIEDFCSPSNVDQA